MPGFRKAGTNVAKYLIRVRDNPQALQGSIKEGFVAREKYMRGLIESHGGRVEAWYHAYGEDDLIVIVDMEPASGIAFSLALNQTGAVRQTTTPLITSAEMDQARSKLPAYRAPGA